MELFVISEEPEYSVQVSSHNVEKGGTITDHIQKDTASLHLEGLLIGPQAANYKQRLVKAMNEGKLLQYTGRNMMLNCVITSLRTAHDSSIANGMTFTMSLKQVNIVKPAYSKLPPKKKAAVKPKSRSGKRNTSYRPKPESHTVRSGQSIKSIATYYRVSEVAIQIANQLVPGMSLVVGMKLALSTAQTTKKKSFASGGGGRQYMMDR
ncbi:LysM peptidoglycan-binding domain-containing protein [Paenibacillus popilliae]|uniref:LysM peptidoglycan-binding domain-containing protein n=1 Tax=Paenibacillus popilliae TaxID=78057 RepID=UPI0021AFFA14|nr:LysM domain-containing protein [Paenibacillus sp. SDF0028]